MFWNYRKSNWVYFRLFFIHHKGVIITHDRVYILSAGDGYYRLNEKEICIDENNHPSYFAYNLLPQSYKDNHNSKSESKILDFIHIEILENINFDDFDYLMISTDGIEILKNKSENIINILGRQQVVGSIDQFIKNEKYFSNKISMQKRLNILGKNKVFEDDCTFIVVRKVEETNYESNNK